MISAFSNRAFFIDGDTGTGFQREFVAAPGRLVVLNERVSNDGFTIAFIEWLYARIRVTPSGLQVYRRVGRRDGVARYPGDFPVCKDCGCVRGGASVVEPNLRGAIPANIERRCEHCVAALLS
jgi:hypothetical protein